MTIIVVYSKGRESLSAGIAAKEYLAELAKEDEPQRVRYRNADVDSIRPVEGAALALATGSALDRVEAAYAGTGIEVERLRLPSEGPELAPTDLGKGFPARKALRGDGRFAMEADLRAASPEERGSVDGIGPSTLQDIAAALSEEDPEGAPGEDDGEDEGEEDA